MVMRIWSVSKKPHDYSFASHRAHKETHEAVGRDDLVADIATARSLLENPRLLAHTSLAI